MCASCPKADRVQPWFRAVQRPELPEEDIDERGGGRAHDEARMNRFEHDEDKDAAEQGSNKVCSSSHHGLFPQESLDSQETKQQTRRRLQYFVLVDRS